MKPVCTVILAFFFLCVIAPADIGPLEKGTHVFERETGDKKALYKINGATLIDSDYMDGDSFAVRLPDGRRVIFRLYYVDAPETDKRYPDRLREQAKEMGLSGFDEVLRVGEEAKKFTREMLRTHKFSIFTTWRKARGASKTQRYYGMIWLNYDEKGHGSFLCENLVINRLARIHGYRLDTRNIPAKKLLQRLADAKEESTTASR